MAHNLIKDESKIQSEEVNKLMNRVNQHATEQSGNTQVINTHGGQIKSLSDLVKGIRNKLDSVMDQQQQMQQPIQKMKQKLENTLGEIDFPVKHTIVAQNVWFTEGEDLNKIVNLILRTLELPHCNGIK